MITECSFWVSHPINVYSSRYLPGGWDSCRALLAGNMQQKRNIQIIEWEDLDKRSSTRLESSWPWPSAPQSIRPPWSAPGCRFRGGSLSTLGPTMPSERFWELRGLRGLYRGFMVTTFTLISGQAYITTYELVRKYVSNYSKDNTLKSLVAGGFCVTGGPEQLLSIDVLSQQLMMQGQGEHLTRFKVKPKMGAKHLSIFRPGQETLLTRYLLRMAFVDSIEDMWHLSSHTSPTVRFGGRLPLLCR